MSQNFIKRRDEVDIVVQQYRQYLTNKASDVIISELSKVDSCVMTGKDKIRKSALSNLATERIALHRPPNVSAYIQLVGCYPANIYLLQEDTFKWTCLMKKFATKGGRKNILWSH